MPNIKSSKKAVKVIAKKTDAAHEYKARVKNSIKNLEKAIAAKDTENAEKLVKDVQKNILKQMGQLVRLTRDISFDIEPILLIEEDDRSGFLESISKYGEVVYSK